LSISFLPDHFRRRDYVKNIKMGKILHVTNKKGKKKFLRVFFVTLKRRTLVFLKQKIKLLGFFFPHRILIDLENFLSLRSRTCRNFMTRTKALFFVKTLSREKKFMQKFIGGKLFFKSRWNSSLMAQNKRILEQNSVFF
jgi:hypothetical protein